MLVLPGYGDTPEVVTRHLDVLDPHGRWHVAVAEPIATGPVGPMWYEVGDEGPDPDGVTAAVAAVALALDQLAADTGLARHQLVLAGYSQGGALALATTLDPTAGPAPRALAVLAGYLALRDDHQLDPARTAGRPVLVAHGADDTTVDTLRGRAAWKVLDRAGADARWVEVDGGHRLGPALLDPLRALLDELT